MNKWYKMIIIACIASALNGSVGAGGGASGSVGAGGVNSVKIGADGATNEIRTTNEIRSANDKAKYLKSLERKCYDGCMLSCERAAVGYSVGDKATTLRQILCARQDWASCRALGALKPGLAGFYERKSTEYARKACKQNNASACFDLATYGDKKSAKLYQKALTLYTKECRANDYQSCYMLANMHFEGISVPRSASKAINLYALACQNDHAHSCYALAMLHKGGVYARKDNALAKEYCLRAVRLDGGISLNDDCDF